MSESYLTVEETTAIVDARLGTGDERRRAWTSATAEDQLAATISAADRIDALTFRGSPMYEQQARAFPRVLHGKTLQPTGDLVLPTGIAEWSVSGLPRELRIAAAYQACAEIRRMRSTDPDKRAREQAHAGIASAGGAGHNRSMDLTRAADLARQLDSEVFPVIARLRTKWGTRR